MSTTTYPEPWLRGTLIDVPAVPRAVLHALELANEDLHRWCGQLTDKELNVSPMGTPSISFHIRHIARSLDRLLTYAEGNQLNAEQTSAIHTELDAAATRDQLFAELKSSLVTSASRIRAFDISMLEQGRAVGKKQLPATVAGLLVHIADHTQRHVGQAITTAKILLAQRST